MERTNDVEMVMVRIKGGWARLLAYQNRIHQLCGVGHRLNFVTTVCPTAVHIVQNKFQEKSEG